MGNKNEPLRRKDGAGSLLSEGHPDAPGPSTAAAAALRTGKGLRLLHTR